ncbi:MULTISPECIES: TnsA endonuclease N-terminal domain-containing protein [Bacillus]|uniref:TnsA endonuclease N-terminal domain-containing protein n=1 Tax=Bacillus TaxID=1386 RepID=UPI0006A84B3F|nr:TnsA endonuclease N-terminal domain-containing protein [Bacillus cereus]MDA2491064.1 DDE-type integrase/transposase/recombinase [Bacillus cereus]CUB35086.1 Transposon Tn7 transposition protein TnsB [Bacillus cereus]
MFSEQEFQSWCILLDFTKETVSTIQKIRTSPPSRSVRSSKKNLSGKYPSKKMGMSIQYESYTVELVAMYVMEYDDDVIEYYDQPITLKLDYSRESGKRIAFYYTPDFLVLRKDGVQIEEWKTEEQLIKLSEKDPVRYFKDEEGNWRCPPAEIAASQLGLDFVIRSSAELDINVHRNLIFLEAYLKNGHYTVSEEKKKEIINILSSNLGIKLSELFASLKTTNADDVYILIARNEIYVDLVKYIIANSSDVPIFLSEQHSKAFESIHSTKNENIHPITAVTIDVNATVIWDGIVWRIVNVGFQSISLYSDENGLVELPKIHFIESLNNGRIDLKNEKEESRKYVPFIENILKMGPEELAKANRKINVVKRKLNNEKIPSSEVSERTLRQWVKDYKEAQQIYGNGYIGLLTKNQSKGNREKKLPAETISLIEEIIEREYENLKQKNKTIVYGQLVILCEDKNIPVPSFKTFCKAIKYRNRYEQVKKRQGERSAYKHEPFYWNLERNVPKHGDRPFEITHIDHTQLDIQVVCSRTGKVLGRPWLTLLVDAYSRMVLSYYITFESPSYRSVMVALRECVRKYHRLPQSIVVDGGKEFHSIYFETFTAMYEINKKVRPPAKARFGSVIERLFGTSNSNFLHNLRGNTQITKNVRQVTKAVNPVNQAIWTLENLEDVFGKWLVEVYSNNVHPSLEGLTPNEALNEGIYRTGERQLDFISYDENFIVTTLPSTRNGVAKVNLRTGIKVNYINYWSPALNNSKLEAKSVPVRYDPFNIGIAYAYVNKKWIKCTSEYYHELKGKTERELKLAMEEIKKRKQNHVKGYSVTAKKIAEFINNVEEKEKLMAENMKRQLSSKGDQNEFEEKYPSSISSKAKDLLENMEFQEFNIYKKGG